MFDLLKKGPEKQLGLEITPDCVNIVYLVNESGKTFLKGYYTKNFVREVSQNGNIETPEVVTEAVKALIIENKIDFRIATLCVPSNAVFIKKITLPDLPYNELKAIAPQEASKHLPLTMNELNVDFQILESTRIHDDSGKRVDVIICAIPKTTAKTYLDLTLNSGLYVEVIDIAPFAAVKSLANSNMIDDPDKIYISVLIGYENTDINIIQNGMPLFSHYIQTGKKNVLESIENNLHKTREESLELIKRTALSVPGYEMNEDQELNKAASASRNVYSSISREIQKTIEYFYSENQNVAVPDKIFLSGSGICVKNIDKYIFNKLKIETVIFNPFAFISKEMAETQDIFFPVNISGFSVSTGLALRGLEN
jgi:type IV pilus assembly protein PilM